ncbi:Uncharacterised protein [Mycobacteroides abscessus subsp. abscessus]|nr:Uncharacterised protein [Mycobacteroides abscessus subsp. abscessus]
MFHRGEIFGRNQGEIELAALVVDQSGRVSGVLVFQSLDHQHLAEIRPPRFVVRQLVGIRCV